MRRPVLTAIVWSGVMMATAAPAAIRAGAPPRATDLLTAQRAAADARKRLQLPAARARGWMKGGDGFGHDRGERAPAEKEPQVHIHVGGGAKRAAGR